MGIGDIRGTRRLLLQLLDCAFDKRSWHGANLTSAIRGVRAPTAAKTIPRRKSIWQQVLHAAYWKHAALNKLVGTTPFPRRGSNWPKLPERLNEKAWRDDVNLLRDQHRQLRHAIVKLPTNKLNKRIIWLIHGVAAHDVYHAGQIKLLRRLI